ncbi:MAG: hypothetical protein Q9216_006008 [Gyalolechia sp. 2 TL-2023]
MKIVPTTEKQEATRSVVSRPWLIPRGSLQQFAVTPTSKEGRRGNALIQEIGSRREAHPAGTMQESSYTIRKEKQRGKVSLKQAAAMAGSKISVCGKPILRCEQSGRGSYVG